MLSRTRRVGSAAAGGQPGRPVRPVAYRSPRCVTAAKVHASAAPSQHVSAKADNHTDHEGPSLLNYAATIGEAFSSSLSPEMVAAAYALSISSVLHETYEKCQRSRAVWDEGCHEAAEHSAAHGADVICSASGTSQRRVQGALAGRRALEAGMIKMIGTVAIPSLVMHGITHCGWDWATDASGTSDMIQAAAGQLAHALHMPADTIANALGKGLPQLAGSFVIPLMARPVEKMLQEVMGRVLRPAIDEFCSRGRSMSMAAGHSFSVAAGAASHSFIGSAKSALSAGSFTAPNVSRTASFVSAS